MELCDIYLNPCLCCGGEAEPLSRGKTVVNRDYDNGKLVFTQTSFHMAHCKNCGAKTKFFDSPYDMADAWNKGEVIKTEQEEMLEAARVIKKNCYDFGCDNCCLYDKKSKMCKLFYVAPYQWDID